MTGLHYLSLTANDIMAKQSNRLTQICLYNNTWLTTTLHLTLLMNATQVNETLVTTTIINPSEGYPYLDNKTAQVLKKLQVLKIFFENFKNSSSS